MAKPSSTDYALPKALVVRERRGGRHKRGEIGPSRLADPEPDFFSAYSNNSTTLEMSECEDGTSVREKVVGPHTAAVSGASDPPASSAACAETPVISESGPPEVSQALTQGEIDDLLMRGCRHRDEPTVGEDTTHPPHAKQGGGAHGVGPVSSSLASCGSRLASDRLGTSQSSNQGDDWSQPATSLHPARGKFASSPADVGGIMSFPSASHNYPTVGYAPCHVGTPGPSTSASATQQGPPGGYPPQGVFGTAAGEFMSSFLEQIRGAVQAAQDTLVRNTAWQTVPSASTQILGPQGGLAQPVVTQPPSTHASGPLFPSQAPITHGWGRLSTEEQARLRAHQASRQPFFAQDSAPGGSSYSQEARVGPAQTSQSRSGQPAHAAADSRWTERESPSRASSSPNYGSSDDESDAGSWVEVEPGRPLCVTQALKAIEAAFPSRVVQAGADDLEQAETELLYSQDSRRRPVLRLKESNRVARALEEAMANAQGRAASLSPVCPGEGGSLMDLPHASPVGQYFKIPKPPRPSMLLPVVASKVPTEPLPLTEADASILPGQTLAGAPKEIMTPLSHFMETERASIKALELASALDSISGSLGQSLFGAISQGLDPEEMPLRKDLDSQHLKALLKALGQHLQYMNRLLVMLYSNNLLRRRDAVLSRSIIKSAQSRAALRAQMPTQGSLFGPAAEEALTAHVEMQRKAIFVNQPRSAPPGKQSSQRRQAARHAPYGARRDSQKSRSSRGTRSAQRQGYRAAKFGQRFQGRRRDQVPADRARGGQAKPRPSSSAQ